MRYLTSPSLAGTTTASQMFQAGRLVCGLAVLAAPAPGAPVPAVPTRWISCPKVSPHPKTSHPTLEPQTIGTDAKDTVPPHGIPAHIPRKGASPLPLLALHSQASQGGTAGTGSGTLLRVNGPTGVVPLLRQSPGSSRISHRFPHSHLESLSVPISLSLQDAHSGSWGKSRVCVGNPWQSPGCIPAFPVGTPRSSSLQALSCCRALETPKRQLRSKETPLYFKAFKGIL